jgi:hypothetical protein
MEVNIDRRDLQSGMLVTPKGPSNQALMLGIGAEHADRVGDDHGTRSWLGVHTTARKHRGRKERD